jgi:hypothetical protein
LEVAKFRDFLGSNIHERLNEMDLVQMLTFVIFTMTVSHHLWGHIHYGSTDSRYVSAATRKTESTTSIKTENELFKVAEPKDIGLLRMSVIVSTRRSHVKISADLSDTTSDPVAKDIFRQFHERLTLLEKMESESSLVRIEDIACSAML